MLKIRKIAKRDVIYPFYVKNKSANGKRREKMDSNQEMFFEHLVIGSGLAGLSSALMLADAILAAERETYEYIESRW